MNQRKKADSFGIIKKKKLRKFVREESLLDREIRLNNKYLRPEGRSISKTNCFAHQKSNSGF
jgi:hypothetical protein